MLRRLILFVAAFIITDMATKAQIIGNDITVSVTPDHADWTYRTGETIRFNVCVAKSGVPLPDAKVTLASGPEWYADKVSETTLAKGTTTVTAEMKQP